MCVSACGYHVTNPILHMVQEISLLASFWFVAVVVVANGLAETLELKCTPSKVQNRSRQEIHYPAYHEIIIGTQI